MIEKLEMEKIGFLDLLKQSVDTFQARALNIIILAVLAIAPQIYFWFELQPFLDLAKQLQDPAAVDVVSLQTEALLALADISYIKIGVGVGLSIFIFYWATVAIIKSVEDYVKEENRSLVDVLVSSLLPALNYMLATLMTIFFIVLVIAAVIFGFEYTAKIVPGGINGFVRNTIVISFLLFTSLAVWFVPHALVLKKDNFLVSSVYGFALAKKYTIYLIKRLTLFSICSMVLGSIICMLTGILGLAFSGEITVAVVFYTFSHQLISYLFLLFVTYMFLNMEGLKANNV